FMSGLRPTTTGIYGLNPSFRASPVLRNAVTLPQYFAAHGYRTMQAGKVYHDAGGDADFHVTAELGPGYRPPQTLVEGVTRAWGWGVTPPGTDTLHADHLVASWAEQQLDSIAAAGNRDPFFMALGMVAPHVPLYAEQEWFGPAASAGGRPGRCAFLRVVPPLATGSSSPFLVHRDRQLGVHRQGIPGDHQLHGRADARLRPVQPA
ncbi:MAG TPA: hypothetical protein VNZ55_11535, partial [Thermomicrobiales bacterium]|nr:hypothetical protein [Thermomicrobiales bacterium]